MPTVVFVASIQRTLAGFIAPVSNAARSEGWATVGIAASENGIELEDQFDRIYDLPSFRRGGPLAHLRALVHLVKILRQESPDVVHLSTPSAILVGRIAAFWCRIPSISAVHGTYLEPFGLHAVAFRSGEIVTSWMSRFIVVLNEEDVRFYRRLTRSTSVLLAPAGGAGVVTQSDRSSMSDFAGNNRLLYMGRLAKDKNMDLLVDAFIKLQDLFADLELFIVGSSLPGDPTWTPRLLPGITFCPWTDTPEVEIASASVVVTASDREGFSMLVAEALIQGVRVVAVSNRGSRQQAKQAGVGLTICEKNIDSLASAISANLSSVSGPREFNSELAEKWGRPATTKFLLDVMEATLPS